MSFSGLAPELLFEVASHIDSDDVTTLLHFAMVNQQLFAIVMPKLIAAQSTRIHELTPASRPLALTPIERVFLEPTKITYRNYWFHEDCRDNVFAQSYNDIYLLFQHQFPKHMYAYACALLRRAPRIDQVTLDLRYKFPSNCMWMGRLLDVCAQRFPPPRLTILGKPESSTNGAEFLQNGPFIDPIAVRGDRDTARKFKTRKFPLKILNSIARRLTTFAPFPPIPLPQDARPHPRQPPRVSTKRSYECICWSPTHPVPVGRNPILQELYIWADSMFTPSMYPYTLDFINLTPLVSLYFSHIELGSRAWSQILYCLQIPTLTIFVVEKVTIAFLDIVFFLQRHQSIICLNLFLDLHCEYGDGSPILPSHFNLTDLQVLRASGVYATLFMQHHTGHKFKKLRSISITNPLPTSSDIEIIELFHLYDLLAAHYDQYTEVHFLFPFRFSHFVEWALEKLSATDPPDSRHGILGVVRFGTPEGAAIDISDQTFSIMSGWVEVNCNGWSRQEVDVQTMSRRHVFQEFIYAICPLLKVWDDGEEEVGR